MPENPEPYDLTPTEAAKLVGVHRDTLVAWSDRDLLPVWVTPTGQRRYRRSDVLALLEQPREASQ